MVHSLNLAMKYFDQLQVMPIFMIAIMVLWICSGLTILEESKYYTWGELFSLYASFAVCCIGIKILMSKIKQQKLRKWRERASSIQSIGEDQSFLISNSHLNNPGLNESLNYCKSEARLQDTSSDYKFAEGGINSGEPPLTPRGRL